MSDGLVPCSSFKPDFFIRNNLEHRECRVLISTWESGNQWKSLASGVIEVNLSVSSARIYLHFSETPRSEKLFEIDIKDFSITFEKPTAIILKNQKTAFQICLAFESQETAGKYIAILDSLEVIRQQVQKFGSYELGGGDLMVLLSDLFKSFLMEKRESFLGGLIWFSVNHHSLFFNKFIRLMEGNSNNKKVLEKLQDIIVTLYSFKDTVLFTKLIEKPFFDLTRHIRKRLVDLVAKGEDRAFNIDEKMERMKLSIDDQNESKMLVSFLRFKWVYLYVLEPYLDSKDLSAYSTFLKIREFHITTHFSKNSKLIARLINEIHSWDSNLTHFMMSFFGQSSQINLDPGLFSCLLSFLFERLSAVEFFVLEGTLVVSSTSQEVDPSMLEWQIQLLSLICTRCSTAFVQAIVNEGEILRILFCLALCGVSLSLLTFNLISNILNSSEVHESTKMNMIITNSLSHLSKKLQIRPCVKFVGLLNLLLKNNFLIPVKDLMSCKEMMKMLIQIVQENANSKMSCSVVASLLNEYVSRFRFASGSEELPILLSILERICRGRESLLSSQVGTILRMVQVANKGNSLSVNVAQ